MSEATPLLLNMGAEVASATGLNPMPGQLPATGNNGNEFAGVLQSVLTPAPQQASPDPLLAKQLQANPLLLAQLGDSANPLLTPGEINLEALPTGNSLPIDEQELAWQTLLAEYDSNNPDTPRVVLASGDAEGYQLEEFTADDLIPVSHVPDPAKQNHEELPELDPQLTNSGILTADNPANTSSEPATESPTVMASVHGQDVPATAKPVISSAEEEALSKVAKAQLAGTSRPASPVHVDANQINGEAQAESNQLFQKNIEQLAGHGKLDNMETVGNKFDSLINAAAEQAATIKPATLTGASTYATVSGLGAGNPSSLPSAPTIANLTIPPQNPAWGDTVGDRVQWMAAQNIQEAKIRLHPQELGSLEVHIQVGKDQQTSISFSSPHSQVRDALETAIPRLREMFGENGLTLGDVNVSQHSSSEQGHAERDNKPAGASQSSRSPSSHDSVDVAPSQQILTQGNGMLDLYA